MNEYETTGLRDRRTTYDVTVRSNQPPSSGYGVPVWSVVSSQRSSREGGFTLAELVVSVGVLVVFVLLVTQLLNSAATITTLGHKEMDTDSEAREVFDRMAIDFAQMVRRADVDYYLKSNPSPTASPTGLRTVLQSLDDPTRPDPNDQIAFYSTVPGYYAGPMPTPAPSNRSPLSIVAYRIYYPTPPPAGNNAEFLNLNKLERMGQGLAWNGLPPASNWFPVVFMPVPLASAIPTPELPSPTVSPAPGPISSQAGSNILGWCNPRIPAPGTVVGEVIGQGVFRFEYYYLLKSQVVSGTTYNPVFTDTPWDTRIPGHIGVAGMQDVAAIVVDIAVIDPRSKVLLPDIFTYPRIPDIRGVAMQLIDWGKTSCVGCPTTTQWQAIPGLLRAQWQDTLNGIINATISINGKILPRPAIQGIRVYERYFYLSPTSTAPIATPTPTPGP